MHILSLKQGEKKGIPSLTDKTIATTMYTRLKTVENPSQNPSADKWGTEMAKIIQAMPDIAMQCGSFKAPSSRKSTYRACMRYQRQNSTNILAKTLTKVGYLKRTSSKNDKTDVDHKEIRILHSPSKVVCVFT